MLEIIILYFLTKKIGQMALQKGLKTSAWKIFTVVAWFAGEIVGFIMGFSIFGTQNLLGLIALAFFGAFGGYLLIRYILEQKQDVFDDDGSNRTKIDELGPKR